MWAKDGFSVKVNISSFAFRLIHLLFPDANGQSGLVPEAYVEKVEASIPSPQVQSADSGWGMDAFGISAQPAGKQPHLQLLNALAIYSSFLISSAAIK